MDHEPFLSTSASHSRKLTYIYYNNYGSGRRWWYWGIPIIAVGVFVFIVAIFLWMRRRRLARMQVVQPQFYNQQPHYQQPVTGYPTPPTAYTTPQYGSEYNNYNSVPPQGGSTSQPPYPTPFPTQGNKPGGDVELGYPSRY